MACMYAFAIAEVVFVGVYYHPLLAWLGSYLALFAAAGFSKVVFKRRPRLANHIERVK